jgi:putative ATP-binding cassette transporter
MDSVAGPGVGPPSISIDRRTRARFARMLRAFLVSPVGRRARWLAVLLVLLLVGINGLNVVNSYVGRNFMTALERRTVSVFLVQAVLYIGVFAVSTLVEVSLRYTEETLALTWREWLTRSTVHRYLQPPVYYRLNKRLIANREIANPDERIADDIRAFTATTLSFLILLLNGTFTVLAFSGVVWSISPLLFLVTILYAGAGSFLAVARGRSLVGLNVTQLDKEANFRADLIHVRENAESVALGRWERRLEARLSRRIDEWKANFRRIIAVHRNVGFLTTGYNYLIPIIPVLVVAPLFIRGHVEFGVVTQSAMAFAQLSGAFSLIVTEFGSISTYAAVVARLGALAEAVDQAQSTTVRATEVCPHGRRTSECPLCSKKSVPASVIAVSRGKDGCGITYEHLTLLSPGDGRVLTKDLSATVPCGMRLLVRGSDDEARTALFRATGGTWDSGEGRITRPGDEEVIFLSERTYLPPGTLREAMSPPGRESSVPEDRILEALRTLGLEPALQRVGGLDAEHHWDAELSLGEQQLMAFARILLLEPDFVFLNRAGTALDAGQLRRSLDLLAQKAIGVVMDEEGGPAPGYFHAVLELGKDGQWTFRTLDAGATGNS